MSEATTIRTGKWADRAGRALRTFLVLIAVALAVGAVQMIGEVFLQFTTHGARRLGQQPPADAMEFADRARKVVSSDGRIYLRHVTRGRYGMPGYVLADGTEQLEVRDSAGTVVYSGEAKGHLWRDVGWAQDVGRIGWRNRLQTLFAIKVEFPTAIVIPVRIREHPSSAERWRYEPEAGVFAGYDRQGRPLGYLGADGSAPSVDQTWSFGQVLMADLWTPTDRLNPILIWLTDRGLFLIDVEERSVQQLATESALFVHLSSSLLLNRPLVHVGVDEDTHRLLLPESPEEIVVRTPEAWRDQTLSFAIAGENLLLKREHRDRLPRPDFTDRKAVKKWRETTLRRTRRPWLEVYRVGPAGELALTDRFEWAVRPRPFPKYLKRLAARQTAIRSVSPAMYRRLWAWSESRQSPDPSMRRITMSIAREVTPFRLLPNYLLASVFAALAAWHGWARRTSWVAFIAWVVFVFVFNLPGLLTYLALNHTPVIRCAACGKKRGLARADCRACGAPLPTPESKTCDQSLMRPAAA